MDKENSKAVAPLNDQRPRPRRHLSLWGTWSDTSDDDEKDSYYYLETDDEEEDSDYYLDIDDEEDSDYYLETDDEDDSDDLETDDEEEENTDDEKGMDSASSDQLPSPKSLQFLVCDLKDDCGNYPIHLLVLYLPKPSDSYSESYIRAALRSFPEARVNSRNDDGFTALHLAVVVQNSFMAKMLLSSLPTVDVNAKCVRGNAGTALHLAAAAEYFDREFPFCRNDYGRTALGEPVEKECVEIVKALVQYGAPADVDDCMEALLYAAIDLNARDRNGTTPLQVATKYKCWETAKVLVESGASINVSDKHSTSSPLHDVVGGNQIDVLKLLISKGADVNARESFRGYNLLHVAVEERHLEMVRVLIECGATVDQRNKFMKTALHFAAVYKQTDVLELLISKGADVGAKERKGKSPLHVAAEDGCLEAVKALVERGASVNAIDKYGRTPLHFVARHRNKTDVLELLISKGADVNARECCRGHNPLHVAVEGGHLETVRVLVECGATVDQRSEFKKTALHFAAASNRVDILEFLIGKGADVGARERKGRTPLHVAVYHDRLEAVKALVECGASVSSRAFRIARRRKAVQVIKYLTHRPSPPGRFRPVERAQLERPFKCVEVGGVFTCTR